MEEKITTDNVEMCIIRASDKQLKYKTKDELNAIIETLAAWNGLKCNVNNDILWFKDFFTQFNKWSISSYI